MCHCFPTALYTYKHETRRVLIQATVRQNNNRYHRLEAKSTNSAEGFGVFSAGQSTHRQAQERDNGPELKHLSLSPVHLTA